MSDPNPNPNSERQPTPTPAPSKSPEPAPTKGFSQEDVDRILNERLARDREAQAKKFREEHGFASDDEVKTFIVEAKKRADAEKTDVERANEAAQQATRERDELKAQYEQEKQARILDRRNNAITTAATKALAPKDVLRWAEDEGKDLLAKVLKDDGEVDPKAVDALIEACAKAMPHYFTTGSAPGTPSFRDGRTPKLDDKAARDANFRRIRRGV
jgi:hypothetical protein